MLKYGALLFNTIALLMYQFFFAEGVTITQNIPSSAKAETEFTVELTINKGATSGFAKLQQDLPEGFTAVQDDNNGASFTFSNQSVKLIWMSLPGDKEFKIKYKVKVAAGVSGEKTIAGKFSYVVDNVKQSVDIAPSVITIQGPDAVATTTTPTDNTANTSTNTDNTTANTTTTTTTDNTTTTTTPTTSANEPSSVVCTRKAPESVTGDFTVEIVINKGNVTGFAKLLETLPAGFTATQGESQGASFSFNETEGKVKFVWVSMPAVPEFRISYKVSAAAGSSGSQTIDGVFSYIENDETKKHTIPATVISVGSSVATSTTTTTDTPPVNADTNKTNTTTSSTTTTPPDNTTTTNTTATTTNPDNSTKDLSATTIPAPQGNANYRVQIAALKNPVEADKLATRFNINQKIDLEMAEGFTKYLVGSHSEYKAARDAREQIKSKGVNDAFVTAYNTGKRITVQEALMITSQKWYR
jgi:cell division septation protein DedD